MIESMLEAVMQRLDRLERQNRWRNGLGLRGLSGGNLELWDGHR
jgi:hypothetical protein